MFPLSRIIGCWYLAHTYIIQNGILTTTYVIYENLEEQKAEKLKQFFNSLDRQFSVSAKLLRVITINITRRYTWIHPSRFLLEKQLSYVSLINKTGCPNDRLNGKSEAPLPSLLLLLSHYLRSAPDIIMNLRIPDLSNHRRRFIRISQSGVRS